MSQRIPRATSATGMAEPARTRRAGGGAHATRLQRGWRREKPGRSTRAGKNAPTARLRGGLRGSFDALFMRTGHFVRLERASKELDKPGYGLIDVVLDCKGLKSYENQEIHACDSFWREILRKVGKIKKIKNQAGWSRERLKADADIIITQARHQTKEDKDEIQI